MTKVVTPIPRASSRCLHLPWATVPQSHPTLTVPHQLSPPLTALPMAVPSLCRWLSFIPGRGKIEVKSGFGDMRLSISDSVWGLWSCLVLNNHMSSPESFAGADWCGSLFIQAGGQRLTLGPAVWSGLSAQLCQKKRKWRLRS